MGSPSQVRAGKTLERWAVRWLKSLGHHRAHRSHQDRQGSHEKGSVPDILGVPLWVECKRLKDAQLDAALTLVKKAWRQACDDRNRAGSTLPVLVVASCGRTGALKLLAVDDELILSVLSGPRILIELKNDKLLDETLLVSDFGWPAARAIESWIGELK